MDLIQLLSALLTPVIAIVTTYIAIQQYRTNRLKLKLELFERRYSVYQSVKDFIRFAVREGNISNEALNKLNDETQDAFFLFGKQVDEYISELRLKGVRLMYVNGQLANTNLKVGDARSELAEEDAVLCTWFGQQLRQSKQVFKKDLGMSL